MQARTLKLGKNPPVLDIRTLRFSRYLGAALPPLPATIDWSRGVQDWPMYDNDRYGDCTCAAVGHMIEAWTTSAGAPRKPTNAAVIKLYEHFTPPGPENGCNMLDVLNYWRRQGISRDRITAYASLAHGSTSQARAAVALFGGCYVGVTLPRFAVDAPDLLQVPWTCRASDTSPAFEPDPDAGHCVNAVGYDNDNLYVVTWGAIKAMGWLFYQRYCDESYAVLSTDFLARGVTPAGFDLAALQSDLQRIDQLRAA